MTYSSKEDPVPARPLPDPQVEELMANSYLFIHPARIDYKDDPSLTADIANEVYSALVERLVKNKACGPLAHRKMLRMQYTSDLLNVPDMAIRLTYATSLTFGVRILSYNSMIAGEGRPLVDYKLITADGLSPEIQALVDEFVSQSHGLGLQSYLYEKPEGYVVLAKGRLNQPHLPIHYLNVELAISKNNHPVFRNAARDGAEE